MRLLKVDTQTLMEVVIHVKEKDEAWFNDTLLQVRIQTHSSLPRATG
jgi:hypothetical protein